VRGLVSIVELLAKIWESRRKSLGTEEVGTQSGRSGSDPWCFEHPLDFDYKGVFYKTNNSE